MLNSYQNPLFCEYKVRIVQKILGKASDDSLLLKVIVLGPQNNDFDLLVTCDVVARCLFMAFLVVFLRMALHEPLWNGTDSVCGL